MSQICLIVFSLISNISQNYIIFVYTNDVCIFIMFNGAFLIHAICIFNFYSWPISPRCRDEGEYGHESRYPTAAKRYCSLARLSITIGGAWGNFRGFPKVSCIWKSGEIWRCGKSHSKCKWTKYLQRIPFYSQNIFIYYFFSLPYIPIFFTMQLSWMVREGGRDSQDHIFRILEKLLSVNLQAQINRPGLYGKKKFHSHLEDEIKSKLFFHYILIEK